MVTAGPRVDVLEQLLALFQVDVAALGQRQARQFMAHVAGDVAHAVITEHLAPGRHHADAPIEDGGLDGFGVRPVALRPLADADPGG